MIAFSCGLCLKWEFVINVRYSLFTERDTRCLFRLGVISPFIENRRSTSVRFTFLPSICNTEFSDLVENLCGMVCVDSEEEKEPRRCSGSEHSTAQHRNSHVLSLEHRKTGRVFSYPFNVTSKYS